MKKSIITLTIFFCLISLACQQAAQPPVREDIKTSTMRVVKYDNMYFFSGITGRNLDGSGYPEGITAQTENLMEKYKNALSELGLTFDDIIKANMYITDIGDKPAMNKVYNSQFAENRPMRVCVVVGLEGDAVVEMDAIAVK